MHWLISRTCEALNKMLIFMMVENSCVWVYLNSMFSAYIIDRNWCFDHGSAQLLYSLKAPDQNGLSLFLFSFYFIFFISPCLWCVSGLLLQFCHNTDQHWHFRGLQNHKRLCCGPLMCLTKVLCLPYREINHNVSHIGYFDFSTCLLLSLLEVL